MSPQKLSWQVMGAILTALLIVGCSSASDTPTIMPTLEFTLAKSSEEVVGTWIKRSGTTYIRIDDDGTLREARALDDLDSQPFAINSYQFTGTQMLLKEVSVEGVPSCGGFIDSFEIRLLESGNIWIVTLEGECRNRAGSFSGEYEPVR